MYAQMKNNPPKAMYICQCVFQRITVEVMASEQELSEHGIQMHERMEEVNVKNVAKNTNRRKETAIQLPVNEEGWQTEWTFKK